MLLVAPACARNEDGSHPRFRLLWLCRVGLLKPTRRIWLNLDGKSAEAAAWSVVSGGAPSRRVWRPGGDEHRESGEVGGNVGCGSRPAVRSVVEPNAG